MGLGLSVNASRDLASFFDLIRDIEFNMFVNPGGISGPKYK